MYRGWVEFEVVLQLASRWQQREHLSKEIQIALPVPEEQWGKLNVPVGIDELFRVTCTRVSTELLHGGVPGEAAVVHGAVTETTVQRHQKPRPLQSAQ